MKHEARMKEFFVNNKIPMRYNSNGKKIINCEKCGAELECLATTDNFYSSHDLFICRDCNIGYKAKIFTSLGGDQYLNIEPTLISDIEIIINSGSIMEKYRKKTREEIARTQVRRGRPAKNK